MIERFNLDFGAVKEWAADGEFIYFSDLPAFIQYYLMEGSVDIGNFDDFLCSFADYVYDLSDADKCHLIDTIKSTM